MLHWIEIERGERWHLIRGMMAVRLGSVQCFDPEGGAYYGTWEDYGERKGGRTGAMSSLDECKRAVEEKVGAS